MRFCTHEEMNSLDQRFMTQHTATPTSELRPGLQALGSRCLDQGSLLTLLGFSLAADLYPLAVELGSPTESGAMHGVAMPQHFRPASDARHSKFRVAPLSRLWQHSEFKPLASTSPVHDCEFGTMWHGSEHAQNATLTHFNRWG